jgi:hypothetical protein
MASEQEKINALLREQNKLRREAKQQLADAGATTAQQIKDFKAGNDLYSQRIDRLKEINEQLQTERESQKQVIDEYIQQEGRLKGLTGLQASLSTLEHKRLNAMANMKNLDEDKRKTFDSIASLQQDLLALSSEDVIARREIGRQLDAHYADLEGVRGVHAQIRKNLLDQRSIAEGVSDMTEKQQAFLNEQHAVYEGIRDTIGKVLETASLLAGTWGGRIGAAVMGAGYAMEALGKTTRDFGGYLGGATISATALGTIFPNAAEAAKELSNEMGGLNDVSFQNQLNTNLMATNMGISVGEAAKLTSIYARVTDGSIETAQNLAASTKEFAKQNGIAPSQAMSDIANNAEKFAEYGADSAIELSKAAVQARKLGVSMDTLGKVTDSLLDFESSITNELELSAMLGRNINLNQARGLAYEGKMGAAVKETIKQLGGRDAFNRMDIFQKREAAKTLGISVDELSKMAENMDKLNDDGTFQKTTFESWSESLTAFSTGPLGNVLKTFGSVLVAAGQMTPFLKDMGINLGAVVKGTGQILKNLWDMTGGKVLGGLGKVGSSLMNYAADSPISKTFSSLKDKLLAGVGSSRNPLNSNLPTTTPATPPISSPDAGGSTGKLTESISKIKMNDVVKGAAALVLIAGAMWVLGKALQEFQGIGWDTLAVAGVALLGLTLALAGVGAIMMSGVGAVAILAGAAAMLVIAASLYVLGKALQEIAIGFHAMEMIQPILSGLVSMVGGILMLAGAFGVLAASLAVLAVSGIAALPALLGLAAVGAGMGMLFSVLGIGDDESSTGGGATKESLSEYESSMLSKMDALINEVAKGRDVYLDRDKVTAVVSRTTERSPKNVFGVNNA